MNLVESLNQIINEAMWDYDSPEYKDMMSKNNALVSCMEENCNKLGFELTDRHRLKDGTGRTVFVEYKNNKGNYNHEISLRFQSGELRYIINQEGKQDILTWQNVKTPEDINKAFEEIIPKFEGVE